MAMVAGDKGLLAMDESTGTADKRFAEVGIPQTEEARRAYREMLVTTPDLGTCISAAILFDETVRQKTADGTPFITVLSDAGIMPGITPHAGSMAHDGVRADACCSTPSPQRRIGGHPPRVDSDDARDRVDRVADKAMT
jgi:fructose-bisphosphate aldolase class 1